LGTGQVKPVVLGSADRIMRCCFHKLPLESHSTCDNDLRDAVGQDNQDETGWEHFWFYSD
jgi:hypothetical protein